MTDARPDPDALLARLREEHDRATRAKLKVFFGATAGVGKTYAMLVEAHERMRAGADVVVGLVETHGRRETAALLDGLEQLPRRDSEYRGVHVPEFDLDAALARRPGLLLLDELAHTNVPGSRHAKRWQDVEELLAAGVDVYTTLNVQHVESLIDVVAQITGVTVRETVPDSILDRADEVELVDLPPDDLLQRLREGKVYLPAQAERALESFFRKGNLIALRELALRQTAQRVDAQMESYRRAEGIAEPWAVRERILVCLGDPESGVRLVRAVRRMAAALRAEWIVVHVETPGQVRESSARRDHIVDVMGLAEDLGAEAVMLDGLRVRDEILAFARARNVSRIVVGKPSRPAWLELVSGSLVGSLVHESGDVDVYVMRGEDDERAPRPERKPPANVRWRGYAGTLPVLGVCTIVSWLLYPALALSNLAMLYMLAVVVCAVALGRGPAILASVLGVALFDFVFVPPRFTFQVSDSQYVVTFAVMIVVAVVIGTLTGRLRDQAEQQRQRARRSEAVHELSRDLAGRRSLQQLLVAAVDRVAEVFECRAAVLLPGAGDRVEVAAGDRALLTDQAHERGVAQWVFDHSHPAGLGTDTLPGSQALHLPLVASGRVLGVLALRPADARRFRDPERQRLLATFANQIAIAVERARLSEEAEHARVDVEAERARNALLSAVSHDLRTPLAVIAGAGSSLRDGSSLPAATRQELAETIVDESGRLNRLVGDLLDMTRLESGALRVKKEWHSLEEVVGAVLARTESLAAGRRVTFRAPSDLSLVPLDDVLYAQAVTNVLENALYYSPSGTPVELTAALEGGQLVLEIRDHGVGLPAGGEEKVFEKFWRGDSRRPRSGTGLGLTIARGIAEAHGGRLTAQNHPAGGAVFRLVVPLEGRPPELEREPGEATGPAEAQA
jgi:two-component system sensor histidine kinase KdpD